MWDTTPEEFRAQLKQLRQEYNGKLPAFAWPGGYPIIYLDKENAVLCADCAGKPEEDYSTPLAAFDVYYEGPTLFCEDCNAPIESAYGDPNAEEEEAAA